LEYITRLAAEGYIKGYPDGSFVPDRSITRAEAVTAVNHMLDFIITLGDITSTTRTFPDVPSTHWAYLEVVSAANVYPL
jgi:hypothetical protein